MEYNHIAILLTENCNARCRMCCDCRGEVKGHTLTTEELDIILKQINDYPFAETVGITGGEPMLYPELCEYIMNYNFKRKMRFTIKTNGFWGNNTAKARVFLEKYSKKISKISFSYDEFHKEFIDLNFIKKIIDLCLNYKIKTDIVGCFLKNGMQPGDVLNELGQYAYLTDFYYQPVIQTGAAKKLEEAEFVKVFDTQKDELRCLVTAKQEYSLLINPQLEVYPCCSQCIENTVLNIGNLKETELKDIVEEIKCNKIFHTIFTQGFTPFIKFMKENGIPHPKNLSAHCEICEYLFSTDWFLKILERKKFYDNL